MAMQMVLPHLSTALELALDWPNQSEDSFAEMFARALHCSKAAIWVPDPHLSAGHLMPVGTFGLTPEEKTLVQHTRLNMEEDKLGKLAARTLTLIWTEQVAELGLHEQQLMGACEMNALYCCALPFTHQPLGLVYAASSSGHHPDFQDLQKAAEVVHALTLGLQRHLLLQTPSAPKSNGVLLMPSGEDLLLTTHGEKIVQVNDACVQLLGYTREELIGQDYTRLVHPDDLASTLKAAELLSSEGEGFMFQNRCMHQNGQVLHISWSWKTVGQEMQVRGRNVTQNVQMEGAFQQLFQTNPQPMYIFDEQSLQFLDVNQAALYKYGYSREAFLSMNLLDIRPPSEREKVMHNIRQHPEDLIPADDIWHHITRDGVRLKVLIYRHRLTYHGHPAQMVMVEDVTEQLDARQDLLEAARTAQQVVQLAQSLEKAVHPHEVIECAMQHFNTVLGLSSSWYLEVQREQLWTVHEMGEGKLPLSLLQDSLKTHLKNPTHLLGHTLWLFNALTGALKAYQPTRMLPSHLLLLVPVLLNGKLMGLMVLGANEDVLNFNERIIHILEAVKDRISHALERSILIEQLTLSREETLRTLGMALEYRDYETKGHTDRVVDLALKLGQQLGLSEKEMNALKWGAYLHDTGKIAIPDHILLKPGKLTPEEFQQIQRHSEIGYAMLKNIPNLPIETLEVVLHHHEKWDGSGYPLRLRYRDIPRLARIFTVADVYDALVSKRPYKEPFTQEAAVQEIQRCSGSMFDPEVVEAFLQVMQAAKS